MSGTIINLIIQLIAGAIGGNAVGAAAKNVNLGTAGNTIAGALGGAAGGSLLTSLIPMLQAGDRRHGYRRDGWPTGRRRRFRRDRLGDRRHGHEKHEERLSAFSPRANYCCPRRFFNARIVRGPRRRPFSTNQSAAGVRSISSWD